MKTIMLSQSDINGGAFIAAHRLHQALRGQSIDSTLWVDRKASDDWSVETHASRIKQIITRARPAVGSSLANYISSDQSQIMRSYNWIPSTWPSLVNASDADVVHLQWYNAEMLSIKDVARLKKPVIQTLHDMWAFCGAEHYTESTRWREGYTKHNRPSSESGFDFDAHNWKAKQKHWKKPWQLVAVSSWLAECVKSSALLSQFPIEVIPNPLDTNSWKPMNKAFARSIFNLPLDKRIITFGALAGTSNPRKGYTHLLDALKILKQNSQDIHIVIFGQSEPNPRTETVFPTTYLGTLNDQQSMCALNCASDVYVNPAIQEAFGQTASEAQACGLPVVAFDGTGSTDVIEHELTGYLAQLANPVDLARGIHWVLEQNFQPNANDSTVNNAISLQARERAERLFSYDVVGAQYKALYKSVAQQRLPPCFS